MAVRERIYVESWRLVLSITGILYHDWMSLLVGKNINVLDSRFYKQRWVTSHITTKAAIFVYVQMKWYHDTGHDCFIQYLVYIYNLLRLWKKIVNT